jgi:hypothetical protein
LSWRALDSANGARLSVETHRMHSKNPLDRVRGDPAQKSLKLDLELDLRLSSHSVQIGVS